MSNFVPVTETEIKEFLDLREDDIAEDDLDASDLGLIKPAVVGSQAVLQYEVDGEIVSKPEVEGVIIHSGTRRSLIKGEGDNRETLCSSNDGITGIGDPTGQGAITENPCVSCPMNVWGSNDTGGKACREYRNVGVMLSGDVYPTILNVSPTSLKAYKRYVTAVQKSRKRVTGVITKFQAKSNPHPAGAYASLNFSYSDGLDEASKEVYRSLRATVKPMLGSPTTQAAIEASQGEPAKALATPKAGSDYTPPEHFDGPPPGHDSDD